MNQLNRFQGTDALFDYLNPQNGSMTPMIELPESLNPYTDYNIHIHAKMLSALPLGNVKSIPAFQMLADAERSSKQNIIESSSGNTVASMGILAPYFGFSETHAFVSHEVTKGKLQLLRLFNVTPIVNHEPICPSETDAESGIHKARAKGKEADWYNPDQYANPANLRAHYNVTGPEMWKQTEGHIDYFCAGLGTTGTLVGSSRYLKEQNAAVKSIGIVRAPNNPVPGPRTKNLLNDVSFAWQEACDDVIEIGTVDSYTMSLKMIRVGLMAGPSSGLNLAGTHRFIDQQIACGAFKKNQHDIHIVFPCCDTPYPYMDEYFAVLPSDAFPHIQNPHLLQFNENKVILEKKAVPSITPNDLFELLQEKKNDVVVIDTRPRENFRHYHVHDAVNIPMNELVSDIEEISDIYRDSALYFICETGHSSQNACRYAIKKDLIAFSVEGGMMAWSEKNLPRIKDPGCAQQYKDCTL